ncbi:DHA2 family efflux MFS transporter permease subunit [Peribacillus psychrosaccharolyticus]|uniref:DHA2 family efflux MFS transporter permease subunit n=1 Tax=Peribacillus psychrosaccharolyticus TaxID=1407 RepID=A0A974NJJ2_PERPY|nr:DHA2 family efflux MFS transporter permease subunit [Peribacillus psychrosaccharolyticus]MEC2055285.1 DHA2 family efflux MFS transporter permease subunit [Peribacillus psychrosaccharolyticus]MED3745275.1 DHA2 family efflux MFS transporter permease subunit [Peribacillus psychrosaccharolyticus]QQS98984.1 DHA2 family efflux MFS transporter permease subunit [Peribacillus psychrosaccharolyticus]
MTESINKKVLLTVLILGCFLSTLNQTLLNVALSNLMEVFTVSATTVQWISTGFMLVNGVLIPITAYLMKRFSTRQLFISSMLFLLIGSILCAVSPNFAVLLTGRMIQAIGAGIIMPLLMSVVMFIFPPEKRGSMMGLMGLAIIFAPAIAPTLAGFVIEYYSWRWLFIGIIPFVVVVILLAMKYLINVTGTEKAKLDIVSVILSTVGFGLILYGFSNAGSHGWDDKIVLASILVGVVTIAIFCHRQIKSADPLLNLSVFNYKVFTLTSIINIFVTMMMYADMILLPIYLQNGRGFSAFDAGLLLLPGAIINAFMSPVTGKLFDRFGAKPLFIIGLIFIIPSMWVVTDLTESTTFIFLMVRTIFLRIGLSFITMPLNTAGLNALPKTLVTHGTAVNNTVRQIAGAIGTAVVVTVFTAQTTKHAETLLEETPNATAEAVRSLASIFGSSDAYYFMTILAIIAFVLTLFIPSKAKMKQSS